MTCPLCGSETGLRVSASPKRGEYSDLRYRVCRECGTKVTVIETITNIELCGLSMEVKKAESSELFQKMQEQYIVNIKKKGKNVREANETLFSGVAENDK